MIEWTQGHDEHTWSAKIGDIYKLRVFPGINSFGVIHYHAQVCNVALDELAVELRLPDVETAKRRAVYLTWGHNFALGDALLSEICDEKH